LGFIDFSALSKKSILITGSNGLLGQKLVALIAQNPNYNLIATSKGSNRISKISNFIYESLDITNKQEVEAILEKHQPNVIINTAAMTNVDACELNKEECWKQNVVAVQNFVDVITNSQSSIINCHFIHLSTDFVFDGENGPYTEKDQPNPVSYYGLSKYEAEKIIQKSSLKKWAIARTIIVYGVVEDMSRSNVVLWAKSALEKGDKINVVDDQFRSPTLAEDLAMGCFLIADKGATGIYNLSGKDTMSILELVQTVADFYGLDKSLINPIKSNTLNQPAKRPPITGFILDKAKKDLGYNPHSFLEGLKILDAQLKMNV
jgi:dTDP-4-dehydrorhamnose reductase